MLTTLNHKFIIKLFLLFGVLYSTNLKSQISPKDSIIEGFMIDFHYGFYFFEGDVKDRFRNSSTAGDWVIFKTKKNFLYQINFNYEFGADVKIEDELFENGLIINEDDQEEVMIDPFEESDPDPVEDESENEEQPKPTPGSSFSHQVDMKVDGVVEKDKGDKWWERD